MDELYVELSKRIRKEGLLEKQYSYYFTKIAIFSVLLAIGIFVLVYVDNVIIQLLNAVFLAFVFVQFGLIMHDADHKQIFRSDWKNELTGIFAGNMILGISSGSWTYRHNQHHGAPNHVDLDPDIDIPLLAYSEEQAKEKKGIARFVVKYQAFLWFPLLGLQAFRMRINYLVLLFGKIKNGKERYRFTELGLVLGNNALYFFLVFWFLGLLTGIAFIAVHHVLIGLYMGTIFATNHKGMPLIEDKELNFMMMQIVTTRNVKGSFLVDLWTGGLNYQIEHHLFPTMPRNNLRKAQKIVREFCKEKNIEYYETKFFESYAEILVHFHKVSRGLRQAG